MNFNTRKTLTALECLGLNLTNGTSCMIDVKSLESMSGIRQVSNGSKVIRRDSDVFSKFKYEIHTGENGEIIGYKFLGYKDSNDLISEVSSDIVRLKDKIANLHHMVEDKEEYLKHLIGKGWFVFDEFDLE